MTWILAISLAFLISIALSDIKTRQIPVIYLLGETMSSFCLGFSLIGTSILKCTITNFMIVTLQIVMLWGWIKLKEDKPENNLWSKFGKGDLFMLGISAINLSALNYLFFTVFVSLTSIIIWVTILNIWRNKDQTIPFAGFLAAGLMIIRIFQLTGNGVNFFFDHFILNLIYGIH